MSYKILFEEEFKLVEIKWSKPCSYDELKDHKPTNNNQAFFYKILSKYGERYKLLYIGMTEAQYVSRRLFNADHKKKQQDFKDSYPKHKLWISSGIINNYDPKMSIKQIESLLIYSSIHEYNQHITNTQNKLRHNVRTNYRIINSGFIEGLYKEIAFGLFCKV